MRKAFLSIVVALGLIVAAFTGYNTLHERRIMTQEEALLRQAISTKDAVLPNGQGYRISTPLWRDVRIVDPHTAVFVIARSTYESNDMFGGVEQTLYEQSAEAMWIGAYKAFHHDTHTSDLITRIDDEKGATLKIIRR